MGRQFQVYLMPEDAEALITALKGKIPLKLLGRDSKSAQPATLDTPIGTVNGVPRFDCCIAPVFDCSIETRFVEGQGYWTIDDTFSEIIKFYGGHLKERRLKRGRMYYETGFYGNDHQWHEKPQQFLAWAESIFKVAKKLLVRDRELDAYVGTAAAQFRADGGVFDAS